MFRVLIVSNTIGEAKDLALELSTRGLSASAVSDNSETDVTSPQWDLLLLDIEGTSRIPEKYLETRNPIILLLKQQSLENFDLSTRIADFAVEPYTVQEIVARVRRVLQLTPKTNTAEQIKYRDMIVDLARCEVSVNGKLLLLTYKEFELIKLLAGNPGRVFTREALLSKVWGYDYYGGERTVDVHIRRLRGKLEENDRDFIETVRNIGYRFKKVA